MSDSPDRYFDEKLGVWVTRCPPGEALGARDLTNWSRRRSGGRSGSDGAGERIAEESFRAGRIAKRRRRKERR
jgi:hypothetical protein